MPFLLAEILNFQGSTHQYGVGSFSYIETKDIREVDKVQRDITTLYKEDFSQYEIEDRKLKLKSIYDIIPAELNKQNKKLSS